NPRSLPDRSQRSCPGSRSVLLLSGLGFVILRSHIFFQPDERLVPRVIKRAVTWFTRVPSEGKGDVGPIAGLVDLHADHRQISAVEVRSAPSEDQSMRRHDLLEDPA